MKLTKKQQEEKLEQEYLNQSTPYDSKIKELIKEIQDLKMSLINIHSSYENVNKLLATKMYSLDDYKAKAHKHKKKK